MRMQEIVAGELAALGSGLHTLETGSIRSEAPEYEKGDGWSTLAFARHTKETGGSFVSVDLHTSAAETVLAREGLRQPVDLRKGDSRTVLPRVVEEYTALDRHLDVVLLDSENDENLIMEEFLILRPLLRKGTVVLVDDVVEGAAKVKITKGNLILPYLRTAKYEPQIIPREGNGFTTGVMKVTL